MIEIGVEVFTQCVGFVGMKVVAFTITRLPNYLRRENTDNKIHIDVNFEAEYERASLTNMEIYYDRYIDNYANRGNHRVVLL